MNGSNFGQTFTQGVKVEARDIRVMSESNRRTVKYLITVIVILAVVCLVEGILLINMMLTRPDDDEVAAPTTTNDSSEALSGNGLYFDDDYNIIAFDYKCVNSDGAGYLFMKNNTYQQFDAQSDVIDEGDYSIINSGAVILSGASGSESERIVYYDGYSIMDGIVFYDCKENKE